MFASLCIFLLPFRPMSLFLHSQLPYFNVIWEMKQLCKPPTHSITMSCAWGQMNSFIWEIWHPNKCAWLVFTFSIKNNGVRMKENLVSTISLNFCFRDAFLSRDLIAEWHFSSQTFLLKVKGLKNAFEVIPVPHGHKPFHFLQ